jgi:fructosamine-3-kinase
MWNQIAENISQTIDRSIQICDRYPVSGGSINQAYRITDDRQQQYFVKIHQAIGIEMFAAEAKGLLEIAKTETILVPTPICWGKTQDRAYIVMSDLTLKGPPQPKSWYLMGQQLAQMHQYPICPIPKFGWHTHNTIGATPQINSWETDWSRFFQQWRVGYQLELARRRHAPFKREAELLEIVPQILADYHPQPALVHGDLWSGNAGFTQDGTPAIFDPATYWGDREVDLAMTELFGGFPADFYTGYRDTYPLTPGYERRRTLYNLYHLINHDNLFGGSYHHQAQHSIDSLL